MAFDGIFLAAIKKELTFMIGSRVDRVFQPEKETIILHLRKKRETKKLLLCSLSDQARVHLTTAKFNNPLNPPLLCMVLRKHLEGSSLEKIEQPDLERILKLYFSSFDELGRPTTRILICEVMGKHSNIILLKPNNTIIDASRRYTHAVSRHREVLPGCPYVPPPQQNKTNPTKLDDETFSICLLDSNFSIPLERLLVQKLAGVGPETARELLHRADITVGTSLGTCGEYELSRLWQALGEILAFTEPSTWQPTISINKNQKPLAFAAWELQQYRELPRKYFATPSDACDSFFIDRRKAQRLDNLRQKLEQTLRRHLKRCRKKENLQATSIAEVKGAESWRLAGELITANIYRLEKGQDNFIAENYYEPGSKPVTIKLNPALTPSENAQVYFRRYSKAKNTAFRAREQLLKTRREISYLQSIVQALNVATDSNDLAEIERELQQANYLSTKKQRMHRRQKNEQKKTAQRSQPLEFNSPDGYKILVGKNNRQNDWLTFKQAVKDDLWLHAKDFPGSHVVIKTDHRQLPPATLELAAKLAAHYSAARQSSRVAVDCTLVKHVRKPPGAKPGMVIYDHQRTIYVTPLEIK